MGKDEILVILNAGDKPLEYELTSETKYVDLMTQEEIHTNTILLDAISGKILKRK